VKWWQTKPPVNDLPSECAKNYYSWTILVQKHKKCSDIFFIGTQCIRLFVLLPTAVCLILSFFKLMVYFRIFMAGLKFVKIHKF